MQTLKIQALRARCLLAAQRGYQIARADAYVAYLKPLAGSVTVPTDVTVGSATHLRLLCDAALASGGESLWDGSVEPPPPSVEPPSVEPPPPSVEPPPPSVEPPPPSVEPPPAAGLEEAGPEASALEEAGPEASAGPELEAEASSIEPVNADDVVDGQPL